jgi:prophage regulatory protein
MTNNPQSKHFILRRPEVQARTGLPRSTMYDMIRKRAFPAPVPLGAKAVGWLEHEIDAWLADRAAARRQQTTGGL